MSPNKHNLFDSGRSGKLNSHPYPGRGLDLPILCFFPNSRQKNPNLTKIFFFFLVLHLNSYNTNTTYCYIFTISQNNRIQSHLLLSLSFLIVH